MTIQELRAQAKQMGIALVREDNVDSITAKISAASHYTTKPASDLVPGVILKSNPALSQEELLDGLSAYTMRGLEVRINAEDSTWHIKRGAAEDSGSMCMPLHVVKRKAEAVMLAPAEPRRTSEGYMAW